MECPCAVSLIAVGSFTLFTVGCGCIVNWVLCLLCGWIFPCVVVVLRGTCTVGRFFLQCRILALPRAYCVICTMYAAACSFRVLVYSALLYVATACLLRPSWEMFIGSPKLAWVIVILSVGRGIGRGWVVGLFLWLLEFQQGIKDFVEGYVRIVIAPNKIFDATHTDPHQQGDK